MSDHEPTPPQPGNGLIKTIAPTVGGFPDSGFNPAQPGPAPAAPHTAAPPSISQSQVDTFTFEFMKEGMPYRATILSNPHTGLSATLEKYVGGHWVKSISSMKNAILGAFALQQALQQATSAAKAASGAEAPQDGEGPQ